MSEEKGIHSIQVKVYEHGPSKEPIKFYELEMRRYVLRQGNFDHLKQDFFNDIILSTLRKWHKRGWWEFSRDVTIGCLTKKGLDEFSG